jgi:hypothetical protein
MPSTSQAQATAQQPTQSGPAMSKHPGLDMMEGMQLSGTHHRPPETSLDEAHLCVCVCVCVCVCAQPLERVCRKMPPAYRSSPWEVMQRARWGSQVERACEPMPARTSSQRVKQAISKQANSAIGFVQRASRKTLLPRGRRGAQRIQPRASLTCKRCRTPQLLTADMAHRSIV